MDRFTREREKMVVNQISARGIQDKNVLKAMWETPREFFLTEDAKNFAYEDRAIEIGEGQTISQPLIVAMMTEALKLTGSERVLEIGAGSGYSAVILSKLCKHVYAIERNSALFEFARENIKKVNAENITLRLGDGNFGWIEEAPFDAISVAACAKEIPPPLLEQLMPGGRLVIPIGEKSQNLIRITKIDTKAFEKEILGPVAFVPFIGSERWS